MAAVQGVTVSADLPGTVDRITFESGRAVREGDVLAELDTRQERAQLAAIEAQRELAHLNYVRMKGLLSDRVVSHAEFDRAMAEEKQIVSARQPPSYEPSRSTGARIFDANTRDHQERATDVAYTALAGMTSSTSVPAPASLHTVTLPSISAARSDMPRNP